MIKSLQLAAMLLAICPAAMAQVEPAATGASVPIPAGNYSYSVRYAQTAEFGRSLGNWQNGVFSGSLNYSNGRERFPFSMDYGGGYNFTIAGPSYGQGLFQRLEFTQGMTERKWSLSMHDSVRYSPQAPSLGFTGIPGIGEPVTTPTPNPPTIDESLLTLNTHVVDNAADAELNRPLNYAWGMNLGGSYNLIRYPDGNGIDSGTAGATGGLRWRLSARNSLLGNYRFSKFTYPRFGFSFYTQSGFFGLERLWSRSISTSFTVGPQWTSSSNSSLVPSSRGVAANADLLYKLGYNNFSASYARGVNSGGGYLIGGETDRVATNYSRQLGHAATLGFNISYMRTAGLLNNGVTNSKYGGAQATRRLGRHMSLFANYSLLAQSTSSSLPGNVLGQTLQVLGFGISYSPRQKEQPTQ
ncbi:MAG: hypothetical protein WBD67_08615 [Terracidiphilus sp.]